MILCSIIKGWDRTNSDFEKKKCDSYMTFKMDEN
jgi:hypothetical protein